MRAEDYSTTERYAHVMPRHEDTALVSATFTPMPAARIRAKTDVDS
ncbi:MAG: hypothetical protein M3P39_09050 [Actinomycetota bacterium]|nr:hypothetical protein [Actinomycetota bacterium]